MSEAPVHEIINYLEVSPRLGCAGQPSADQLAAIRAAGYELVVNLALPTSPDAIPDEAGLARQLGMDHISIPVVWEAPSLESLAEFFRVMQAERGRKVFVHCVLNMRVTAYLYLYLALVEKQPLADARQWMDRVWEPDETWQEFIRKAFERYNYRTEPSESIPSLGE